METAARLSQKALVAAALLASASLLATAASAQTTPSADTAAPEGGLADIIVTAQRRAEKLQDVPIAVTAFSGEQIAAQNTRDITSLTGRVPNTYITGAADAPGGSSVFIRGIGFQDIEKSFDPPIGVLLDGVYLGTNTGQLLQTFDVERIEVLRGPQGTLFGRNTTGGAINVTRTLPRGDEISGKFEAVVGSFGRHDFRGIINIPLAKDHLWVKFTGDYEKDKGFYKNAVNPKANGGQNLLTGNATIVWKPVDAFELDLAYDHVRDRSEGTPYTPYNNSFSVALPIVSATSTPARAGPEDLCVLYNFCQDSGGSPKRAFNNRQSPISYDLDAVTANATLHLNGFDIISTTGYRTSKESVFVDFDASPYDIFYVNRPQTYHQFSQELRLSTTGSGPLTFTGGLYYFSSHYDAQQATFLDFAYFLGIPPLPGTNAPAVSIPIFAGNATSQNSRSLAAYFHASYKLSDVLKISVGGRGTFDRKNFTYQPLAINDINFGGQAAAGPRVVRPYAHWNNFSPSVTLDYKVAPSTLLYATYSRGYNQGGFNGRGTNATNLGPYNPEKVQNYELGVKAETANRRLTINADVFHLIYKDKQQAIIVPDPVAGTATIVSNVGAEEINGFEIEATALPIDGLLLNAAIGYLDARYTSFNAILLPEAGLTNNTTLDPVRSPKFTVSGGAEYSIDAGPGTLKARADYRWVDSFFIDPFNDPRSFAKPAGYLDLSLGYTVNSGRAKWKVDAFVKNVTDTQRSNQYVDIKVLTDYTFNFQSYEIGRTFGVQLGVDF